MLPGAGGWRDILILVVVHVVSLFGSLCMEFHVPAIRVSALERSKSETDQASERLFLVLSF